MVLDRQPRSTPRHRRQRQLVPDPLSDRAHALARRRSQSGISREHRCSREGPRLPVAECAAAVTGSTIRKTPGVCGGDACVRDTRIPVWVLANYRRLGAPDAEILRSYPSLTRADLEAAWEYAAANPAEIDEAIRENEAGEEGFVE